jgi:S-DNA-T family DNA segregation ATPase FtsK/SpoIIIE
MTIAIRDNNNDDDQRPAVIEGELVPANQGPRPRRIIDATAVRRRSVAVITTVRGHEPTVRTVAAGLTVLQGFESWGKRAYDASTMGAYRRAIRAAEAAGDRQALAEWLDRKERAALMRHKRLMDAPKLAFGVVKAAGGALIGLVGLVLVLAIVAQLSGVGSFLGVLAGVLALIGFVAAVVAFLWTPLLAALPAVVVVAAYREGKRRGTPPAWAVTATTREQESVIVTPAGIAAALAHLGIAELNKAIKAGWQVEFLTPPVMVNGRGYQAVHSLPMGVTPQMIADKREVYARNLGRSKMEVWPAEAERAGYLDLWVANAGSTEKPAGPYPLLDRGEVDVFDAVPFGFSQRGDLIAPPLNAANIVFGGQMGQGKSNAARVTVIGACLDPICEVRVFVFANNGDFDAFAPRLARYERGIGDEVAAAAVAELRELYDEVGRREARLAELGAKKVTRGLAKEHMDLRPIVALFSECHELFGHEEYGKEAADLAVQTMRRARKTAIVLGFDTQSARADAIPPKIVELVSLNCCFYVKSWRSNDGFLGDGSFQSGIRATELRFNKDRGTAIMTGTTGERFEIVKWCYLEVDDERGFDAATDLIARAMTTVHPAVPTGGTKRSDRVIERRDLLADLAEVLGNETVPAADVPALLARLAPSWSPYKTLTGKALRARLAEEYGVKVPSTGNRWPVDSVTIRDALARRAADQADDEDLAEG